MSDLRTRDCSICHGQMVDGPAVPGIQFCPRCDRRVCGVCHHPVIDGTANHCAIGHRL